MITTYIGPMFSGKSDKLIKVYDSIYNKKNIISFKPVEDSRDLGIITSRDSETKIKCHLIHTFEDILTIIKSIDKFEGKIILIDEAQLIDGDPNVLHYLSIMEHFNIYIAGLQLTSDLKLFGKMGCILAISDKIVKLRGTCYYCGKPGDYTKCLVNKDTDILIGNDEYICTCKDHCDTTKAFNDYIIYSL